MILTYHREKTMMFRTHRHIKARPGICQGCGKWALLIRGFCPWCLAGREGTATRKGRGK